MADSKKANVDLLEEDDEFEEFPAEDWGKDQEDDSDKKIWEDNWDDDNVEDDFTLQLRHELQQQGHKVEPMQQ
ncbi:hypothetical protein EB796_024568 [Bugula neritina]|uniref:26S proteasome complex subunit SEM1 n=1 Tax=Bugula neritina TaxID=10212 RepID=A0A7J7IU97_BUGNE|nr:hypothetical protein EB796_024568 [Bugula neritina]